MLKSNSKAPSTWNPQEVARRLERNLYNSADSKDSYTDLKTLRDRLQNLLNSTKSNQVRKVEQQSAARTDRANSILEEIDKEAEQQEASNPDTARNMFPGMSTTSASQESQHYPASHKDKKLVILQQRLTLLKHARLCKLQLGTCPKPHCATFQKILAHIASCKENGCSFTGCTMAKQLLSHYKMCRNFECNLCNSIRKPMDKTQQTEVLRRQQERLCLLRHASMCHAKSLKAKESGSPYECQLSYCPDMSKLWNHICKCTEKQCTYAHCISSRYVLSHFKECRNPTCEVCAPVRKAIKASDPKSTEISAVQPNNTILSKAKQGKATKRSASNASLDIDSFQQPIQKTVKLEPQLPIKVDPSMQPITRDQKEVSYLDSLTVVELEMHIRSLRYSFSGYLSPTELKNYVNPLLKKLMDHQFGWVFSSPVDPVQLNIPDYFMIIQCPMDLGTIKKRLDNTTYYTSIESVASDVRLTFENCIAYNDDTNEFNILAKDMLSTFTKDVEELKERIDRKLDAKFLERREEMCQLCGGDSFKFAPSMLFCNGTCRGRIRRHTHYYSDASNEYHWCASCFKDMKEKTTVPIAATITGTSNPNATTVILKEKLSKQKNSDVVEEPWVECDLCKRWYHQVCALFNERNNAISGEEEPFHCPFCVISLRKAGKLEAPLGSLNASKLPHSRLSKSVESRVLKCIRIAADEEERRIGKPMDMTGLDINGIAIREVLSVDKKVDVKERMNVLYAEHNQSLSYTYRSRCICVFQKIDGVDVLLFTLYLQEYGEDCPEPNKRRIYVSYLDSVNFFQPKKFRTLMHQQVIIGCLDDARLRGIHSAHIWSCPPLKGDDYIFFCKPENQKIPKAARLRQWYVKLVSQAQDEGTIFKISNLYAEYYQKLKAAHELPYFDGDYWPNLAEVLLKDIEDEKAGKKAPTTPAVNAKPKEEKSKNSKKKRGKKNSNKSEKETPEIVEVENPDILMQKFKVILEPQKQDFFVLSLLATCSVCDKSIIAEPYWMLKSKELSPESDIKPVVSDEVKLKTRNEGKIKKVTPGAPRKNTVLAQDNSEAFCKSCYSKKKKQLENRVAKSAVEKSDEAGKPSSVLSLSKIDALEITLKSSNDPLMPCEIFDTRESFLTYCQSNHCQFDQLRRAKHSSMMILYHLFNQGTTGYTYTCSKCETKIEQGTRWNCSICLGFNLCDKCNKTEKHEHTLHSIACVAAANRGKANKAPDGNTTASNAKRRQIDPALLKLIEHASACTLADCQQNCLRMRALLKHGSTCKSKISGKCPTCRRILGLLKIHAQLCTKEVCVVPRCKDIRDHLVRIRQQQNQLQDRRQTTLIESSLRR